MTDDQSTGASNGASLLIISAARSLEGQERHEAQQRYQAMLRRRVEGPKDLIWHRRSGPENIPVRTAALYHFVKAVEGYNEGITAIHGLVADALKNQPAFRLVMYLDVEGHRDSQGWLDDDMVDLLCNVHVDMSQWLNEIYSPLASMESNSDICRHPFPRLDRKPVSCAHAMTDHDREWLRDWFKVQFHTYHKDR